MNFSDGLERLESVVRSAFAVVLLHIRRLQHVFFSCTKNLLSVSLGRQHVIRNFLCSHLWQCPDRLSMLSATTNDENSSQKPELSSCGDLPYLLKPLRLWQQVTMPSFVIKLGGVS
jgi:hypothetical protein